MGNNWNFFLLLFIVTAIVNVHSGTSRQKRQTADLTPGNWDSCKAGAEAPPTRVDTGDRVYLLRSYFATLGIQGYLIPNEDAHQSEYPSQYDKRRGYISGFQGSAGYAVVTIDKQALWTDGRYFLEAEDTLDCNWILMRQREPGVPTMIEWLGQELKKGNFFGASPFLVGSSDWKYYQEELLKFGIYLDPVQDELIDRFWNSGLGRPMQPNTPINMLPLQYSGLSWQDKVNDMREAMDEKDVDMMVVTSLDETAWLFNLRASDIDYNPFFISYAILENDTVTLFLLDHLNKITAEPTDEESTSTVAVHLNTNNDGTCGSRTGDCVEVKAYSPSDVVNTVRDRAKIRNKVWLGYSCNQAIYSAVNESKIYQSNTPIATTKTRKNEVEVQGMRNSHIRDAVALITFLEKLETEVKAGKKWTELSAAEELKKHRLASKDNRGLSFKSISSSGANGAVIHYRPTPLTDKRITTSEIYLLDSGGQYLAQEYNRGLSFDSISGSGANGAIIHYSVTNLTSIDITTNDMYLLDSGGQYIDGTTDVTRTFHFGTPTDYQKECYTRVLMGHINLFQAKWPKGLYGREIDAFARRPLWDVGLVYRHGTGHGIGMFLSVHEEPGYYEDGHFGIRLENIVMVKNATTTYSFPGTQFLTFEHVTLVPYEPHLIKFDMLNDEQISYLNDYNTLVRNKVGPELKKQKQNAAFDWMMKKTERVSHSNKDTSGTRRYDASLSLIIVSVFLEYFFRHV